MPARAHADPSSDPTAERGRALAQSLLRDDPTRERPTRPQRPARSAPAHSAPAPSGPPPSGPPPSAPLPSAPLPSAPAAPAGTPELTRRERRLLREEAERRELQRAAEAAAAEIARAEAAETEARAAARGAATSVPAPDALPLTGPQTLSSDLPNPAPGDRMAPPVRRRRPRPEPAATPAATGEPATPATPTAPAAPTAPADRMAPPVRRRRTLPAVAEGVYDYLPWPVDDDPAPHRAELARHLDLDPAERPRPRPQRTPERAAPDPARAAIVVDDAALVDDRVLEVDDALSTPARPNRREPGRRRTRALVEWIAVLGTAGIVALVLQTFVFQLYEIPSESMYPTLQDFDRVAVNKLAYSFGGGVERGDVVVFKRPTSERTDDPEQPAQLIKRVIGLPGDVIEARGGRVYVDGEPLTETGKDGYLSESVVTNNLVRPLKVPVGHVFVMGDNREHSHDSRYFGTIPTDDIIGRAFALAWPIGRSRFL